jgi:UDP-glucose 4-epimerase
LTADRVLATFPSVKILVVGGAGYIGSICTELLLDAGHSVAVFDNLTEGHRRAVDERAEFIEGDLSVREQIEDALRSSGVDAVMHFAASALVGESMTNPSKYFRNNVANGVNLLDAMVATGVKRLVFSSTCATFGPPERVPIDETLPQRPINPYGESKLMFERILRWYGEIHGLTFVALRYFNAAGASRSSAKITAPSRTSSRTCSGGARANARTSRFTGPTTRRRMAPASAITSTSSISRRRTLLALNAPKSAFYNIGTGGGSSVREVIDTCRASRRMRSRCRKTAPRRRPARLIARSAKIKTSSAGSRVSRSCARSSKALEVAPEVPERYGD